MGSIDCPIECVRAACTEPDFIEKHGTWLLTVVAGLSGGVGVLFSYFLKSRCSKIKCLCGECHREVVVLHPKDAEIATSSKSESGLP